jgi:predicted amidohydrolase
VFNQALTISPQGGIAERCDKIFPWQPYEAGVTPGCEFCVFDTPHVGRVGLSICYDVWFPKVARALAWRGAELILIPSQTNTIDRDVELSIARATTTMNQCFVFNINSAGDLGVGRSIVCGSGGEVLYQGGRRASVLRWKSILIMPAARVTTAGMVWDRF